MHEVPSSLSFLYEHIRLTANYKLKKLIAVG